MKHLLILSPLVLLCFQHSKDFDFFYNGKVYVFSLPREGYKETRKQYTEGTFFYFKYDDGPTIVLHVGGNVVKPILKEKEYVVKEDGIINNINVRKGHHRNSKQCWEERTFLNGEITLLFTNVNREDLEAFQMSLNTFKIKKVIR